MKKLILILTGAFLAFMGYSQDTIRVGHHFRDFDKLELGTKTDAIYNEFKGQIRGLAIKKRTTEKIAIKGKEYIRIVHEWTSPSTEWNGNFEYICEPNTLKPVQHIRFVESLGKEAFHFGDMNITGLDSASDNKKEGFQLVLDEPTYNWEIDLETYSLIPMKAGKEVVMNFYHPGGTTPPKFYKLKVEGEDKIELPNGKWLDCWVVFTDYGGSQPTRFWYTKKDQNFVKMEANFNGMIIRKVRLF